MHQPLYIVLTPNSEVPMSTSVSTLPVPFSVQVKDSHMKGAKLTVTDSQGWTPLHHAARFGKKDVVMYLADNSKSNTQEHVMASEDAVCFYRCIDSDLCLHVL